MIQKRTDLFSNAFVLLFPFAVLWVPLGGEVLSLLVLLWWLVQGFMTGDFVRSTWQNDKARRILLALLTIIFIKIMSLAWSVAPDLTWRDIKKHLHLLMFIPFVILLKGINKEKRLNQAIVGALLAGAALAIPTWVLSGMPWSAYEYAGATGNSLIFGLIFTLWVIAYVMSLSRGIRWFDWFALAALFFLLFLNVKRSVPLVLLGGLILSGFALNRGKFNWTGWKIKTALAFALSGVLVIFYLRRAKWSLLIEETRSFFEVGSSGGSIDARLTMVGIAWNSWLQNPLLGSGAGSAREVISRSTYSQTVLGHFNHFHNIFLQWLSDVGIIGFTLSVGALWVIHRTITASDDGRFSGYWYRSWFHSLVPVTVLFGLANLSFGINLFHLVFVFVLALAVSGEDS